MGEKGVQREQLTLIEPEITEHLVHTSHCSKLWRYSSCLREAYILAERWGQRSSQQIFKSIADMILEKGTTERIKMGQDRE